MARPRTLKLLGALAAAVARSFAAIGCAATSDHETVASHEDVKDAAGKASGDMIALVTATVVRIGAEG